MFLPQLYVHPLAEAQFGAEDKVIIGTVVLKPQKFKAVLLDMLPTFEFPPNGQGMIPLTPEFWGDVLPGVAQRSPNPADYVAREHRGSIGLYLDRLKVKLPPVEGVACLVYTVEAYLRDPQTTPEERILLREKGYRFVWVGTLAFAGPKPPVDPWRFVCNVSGDNVKYDDIIESLGDNEYLDCSSTPKSYMQEGATTLLNAIREEAQAIRGYFSEWRIVA